MFTSVNARKVWLLVLLSAVLFLLGNNVFSLTNPDEVFYAGTAKEMVEHNSWSVPYLFDQPQFEKPILTYWLIRVAFLMFGVTSFAARFFPALFAILGVLMVYFFCVLVYGDRKKAFLCAFVLMTAGLYLGLARTVFTDLIFAIFIGLSLVSFYIGYIDKKWKSAGLVLFWAFAGLAVLTKGLLGLSMPFGVVALFLFIRRELRFLWCRYSAWGLVLFLVISLPWYWYITTKFGRTFIDEFFVNDHLRRLVEAEHARNDRWYFYPVSTLLCFFPWTIFTAISLWYLFKKLGRSSTSAIYLFLACWIAVPFILVQSAHSKLVSYIVPIYPALAIITGDYLRELYVRSVNKARLLSLLTLGLVLLLPLAVMAAAYKFPVYVSHPRLLCAAMLVFLCTIVFQIWVVNRNVRLFPYTAAFNLAFLFFTFLAFNPYVDDLVASRNAGAFLRGLPPRDMVLCSKLLVRGVRFYSGSTAGVLKIGGGAFFSPHPILFIDSEAQLKEYYFASKASFYGVLDSKDLADAKRVLPEPLDCRVLRQFGDKFVVEFGSDKVKPKKDG